MKKGIKTPALLKIALMVILVGGMVFSGQLVYRNLMRAMRINPALVESYRPGLDLVVVEQAASLLKAREEKLAELVKEEEVLEEEVAEATAAAEGTAGED